MNKNVDQSIQLLIEQAGLLEGLAVCAQSIARSMQNGDLEIREGAAAVFFLGNEIRRISGSIMEIQSDMK